MTFSLPSTSCLLKLPNGQIVTVGRSEKATQTLAYPMYLFSTKAIEKQKK